MFAPDIHCGAVALRMTRIEERREGEWINPDYSRELSDAEIARGKHRKWVGGRYETDYGKTQVDFLREHGMRPEHRFVDIGCGSFRGGRFTIDYLDAGNYYGVDANRTVIEAGYDLELTDAQRDKLPLSNLLANDRFDTVSFGVEFDYALAQSVFSHVSLNHVRLCLFRLAQAMRPGGKFYATFFEEPEGTDLDWIRVKKSAKQRFSERNVYWYYRSDLEWAASFSPWSTRYIGDWGQPAGQVMMEYTRLDSGGR